VVVANQEVAQGTVIGREMIALREIPRQFVTGSMVKPDSYSLVIDQPVLTPLQKGDPLTWHHFAAIREGEGLGDKIRQKTRVVTIEATNRTSVGGWIRPADHVDVIGSFRDPQSNEDVAVTLLQNVIVVATGKVSGTSPSGVGAAARPYDTVSLEVIPEEAEIVVLASQMGELTLTLRNRSDSDVLADRGRSTIQTLLSGERTRVLHERRRQIIEIIRGGVTETTVVR
jgi:pilus assembly protein CpaB